MNSEKITLQIIPALNIKKGTVFSSGRKTLNSKDPVWVAQELVAKGAPRLHVVDIDAALDTGGSNKELIKEVIRVVQVPVQIAGGIRNISQIDQLLSMGAAQVVLGTIAVKFPELVYQIVKNFGQERIIVSVDAWGNSIKYEGWKKSIEIPVFSFIKQIERQGIQRIIFTDIERVHTMKGINYQRIKEIAKHTRARLTIAGGVRSLADVESVSRLVRYHVDSIIVGKAIFTAEFENLKNA